MPTIACMLTGDKEEGDPSCSREIQISRELKVRVRVFTRREDGSFRDGPLGAKAVKDLEKALMDALGKYAVAKTEVPAK